MELRMLRVLKSYTSERGVSKKVIFEKNEF